MQELTENDTITENYVYARFNINDIPPAVLKQIAEAAYIEGWQDGAARITEDTSEIEAKWRDHYMQLYADTVNRWAAILDFDHPKNTPMFMEPDQAFHVVYDYYGNCINYFYEPREDYEPDPDKEPPIWRRDPEALERMMENYDPEKGTHVVPTAAEEDSDD